MSEVETKCADQDGTCKKCKGSGKVAEYAGDAPEKIFPCPECFPDAELKSTAQFLVAYEEPCVICEGRKKIVVEGKEGNETYACPKCNPEGRVTSIDAEGPDGKMGKMVGDVVHDPSTAPDFDSLKANVEGVDTSEYQVGDKLYLKPGTDELTNEEPTTDDDESEAPAAGVMCDEVQDMPTPEVQEALRRKMYEEN